MFLNVDNANDMYSTLMNLLKKRGIKTKPRGMECIELLGVSCRINRPKDRIITEINRKFPIKGAMSEFLWYMSRNSRIEYITPYLRHWENYSDDGIRVNSNYGNRWGTQIDGVIQKIRKDPDTRQGVITLYDPAFSMYYGKDNVCTPDFQFILREGLLHLIVNARSRDMIRGECIDQFTFTYLQEVVANELGAAVGFYQVNIGSLHIYKDHFNLLDEEMKFDSELKANTSTVDNTNLKYLHFYNNLLQYIQDEKIVELDSILQIVLNKKIDYEKFIEAWKERS